MRPTPRLGQTAVTPVVGVILMVALTVILSAAVAVGLNQFRDGQPPPVPPSIFRAQGADLDDNGVDEAIKVSYMNGPADLRDDQLSIHVTDASGTAYAPLSPHAGLWYPGDGVFYQPGPGTYSVSVAIKGIVVVDEQISLK